jgi:hypothetical protein
MAKSRKWEAEHPERVRELKRLSARRRYAANPEKKREIGRTNMRKRRSLKPDAVQQEFNRFAKNNPNYFLEWNRAKTASRLAAGLCIHCGKPWTGEYKSCLECRESNRIRMRQSNKEIRAAVIALYGGRCACCGEEESDFLTIDHINNDGHKWRKEDRSTYIVGMYRYALKEKRADLQLLCYNCNMSKGRYGICPHEKRRPECQQSRIHQISPEHNGRTEYLSWNSGLGLSMNSMMFRSQFLASL